MADCLSSPGPLMPGVDAGNGRYREPTRQGLCPAEVLQALTQLLTHAQHTKLHRMLTTRVCNTVYHQCFLYQTLLTTLITTCSSNFKYKCTITMR